MNRDPDKGKAPEYSICDPSDSGKKVQNKTPLPSSREGYSLEVLEEDDDPYSSLLRTSSFHDIFGGLLDLHQQILGGAGSSSFDDDRHQPPRPPPPPANSNDPSGELAEGEPSHPNRRGSGDHEKALRRSLSEVDRELSGQRRRTQHDHHLSQKRPRSTEMHNKSERRRRERLRERMNTIKELIPKCDKHDTASVLEDAIEYLKALKLQVQAWSAQKSAFCQAPYASPAGMPSAQAAVPAFVPIRPTAQAIPTAGFYRPAAFPVMPVAPAYFYPSLSAGTTGGMHLNPANFPAAASLQAPCFPSESMHAAPAAVLPLLATPNLSAGVSTTFNYSSSRGESSSSTTQVIPSSQDQTGVPQTHTLQFPWSR